MTEERRFPVLRQDTRAAMPRSVPWGFAETFRAETLRYHSQTLERLAERGGLAPEEMYAAAHARVLPSGSVTRPDVDEATAITWLVEAAARYEEAARAAGTKP